jgi:predicted methyltransferase
MQTPLLTLPVQEALRAARHAGLALLHCSLDLQRSTTEVELHPDHWRWQQNKFPYPDHLKDRSVYFWDGNSFQTASRYGAALIKLVPTEWGPPTFELDGIKMLPTAKVSPYADAERKVALIQPRGKVILDCCGGLGYFAAWCVQGGARRVLSFEKNPDVLWLRGLNPWSPSSDPVLSLTQADIIDAVAQMPNESVDAVLHDPPRFRIAGELYSRSFYDQLYRVLKRRGRLFHYTGSPNKISKGRDLAAEVSHRLREAGFEPRREGDGILSTK